MVQTPEGKVKAKVVRLLKAAGVYYFFAATHGYGRSGIPDIVACVDGRFLAIECKAGKNKPTALQQRELDLINKAGGVGMIVNEESLDRVEAAIALLRADGEEIKYWGFGAQEGLVGGNA